MRIQLGRKDILQVSLLKSWMGEVRAYETETLECGRKQGRYLEASDRASHFQANIYGRKYVGEM